MKVLWSLLMLLVASRCLAIDNRELYDVVAQGSVTLPRGNEESLQVQLQTPINFYTEKYDSIYVSVADPCATQRVGRGSVRWKNAIFLDNAGIVISFLLLCCAARCLISFLMARPLPTGDDDKNRYQ